MRDRLAGLFMQIRKDPLEPSGDPPVGGSHQPHRGRDQDDADDRRVDEDADAEPDSELLDDHGLAERERTKRAEQDDRSRRDHAGRVLQACRHRLAVAPSLLVVLLDPRQHEDFVIGRQGEKDRIENHRRDEIQHPLGRKAEEAGTPAVLKQNHEDAVGRAHRKHVHHDGLQRKEDRAEGAQQQQVAQDEDADDEPRERRPRLRGDVYAERACARHEDVGVAEPGRGHVVVPDPLDQVPRLLGPAVVEPRGTHLHDAAGAIDERRLGQPAHHRR